MGNITGIPKPTERRRGVINPTAKPHQGPAIRPESITGICMGRSILPIDLICPVKNGSIILCHNNADHVLDALPLMLERLINAGYEICSVGELIIHDDYYIDNLGIQRKNK